MPRLFVYIASSLKSQIKHPSVLGFETTGVCCILKRYLLIDSILVQKNNGFKTYVMPHVFLLLFSFNSSRLALATYVRG